MLHPVPNRIERSPGDDLRRCAARGPTEGEPDVAGFVQVEDDATLEVLISLAET
jgi:hypothetical protein